MIRPINASFLSDVTILKYVNYWKNSYCHWTAYFKTRHKMSWRWRTIILPRPTIWRAIFGLTENWDYIGGIGIPWKDSHLLWMKLISARNRRSCHDHMGHFMYKAIYRIESNYRKKSQRMLKHLARWKDLTIK